MCVTPKPCSGLARELPAAEQAALPPETDLVEIVSNTLERKD